MLYLTLEDFHKIRKILVNQYNNYQRNKDIYPDVINIYFTPLAHPDDTDPIFKSGGTDLRTWIVVRKYANGSVSETSFNEQDFKIMLENSV